MYRILVYLTHILAVSVFFRLTLEQKPPPPDATLEPQWRLKDGKHDESGCDDDKSALKQSYTEGVKIVQRGLDGLNALKQPRPSYGKDGLELSQDERAKALLWDRQSRLAKTLFAINAAPATGVTDAASKNRLDFAIASMGLVVQNVNDGSSLDTKRRVYCGVGGFKYYGPGVHIPNGKLVDQGKFPDGVFAIPALLPEWSRAVTLAAESSLQHPAEAFCGVKRNVMAGTLAEPKAGLVYWCAAGLSGPATLGTGQDVRNLDQIPRQTMSITWAHELMHMWTYDGTQRIYHVDDEPVARGSKQAPTQPNPKAKAYGFKEAAGLAWLFPDKAVKNADSYALFASALWLEKFDFSIPENDKFGRAVPLDPSTGQPST